MFIKQKIFITLALSNAIVLSTHCMNPAVIERAAEIANRLGGADGIAGIFSAGSQIYGHLRSTELDTNSFIAPRPPSPFRNNSHHGNVLPSRDYQEGMRLLSEVTAHSIGIDIARLERPGWGIVEAEIDRQFEAFSSCIAVTDTNPAILEVNQPTIDLASFFSLETEKVSPAEIYNETVNSNSADLTTKDTMQADTPVTESNLRFSEPDRQAIEIDDLTNQSKEEGNSVSSGIEGSKSHEALSSALLVESKEISECRQVLNTVKEIISPSPTFKSVVTKIAFLDRKIPFLEKIIEVDTRKKIRQILLSDSNGSLSPILNSEKSTLVLKEMLPNLLKYCEKTGNKQLLLDFLKEQTAGAELTKLCMELHSSRNFLHAMHDFTSAIAWNFRSSYNRHIVADHNKVSDHPFTKKFDAVTILCYEGKFEEASKLCDMKEGSALASNTDISVEQVQCVKAVINDLKSHELSTFGIKLKFMRDPLLIKALPAIRSRAIKGEGLANLKQTLEQRHELYTEIRSHIYVSEKMLHVNDRNLIYRMTEAGTDREKQIQILLSTNPSIGTASNFQYFLHPHPEMREYIPWPRNFSENKNARLLYAQYSTITSASREGARAGRQGISLIMQSHDKVDSIAKDYLYLGEKIRDNLLGKNDLSISAADWLKLNFCRTFPTQKQNQLKDTLISAAAQKLRNLEKEGIAINPLEVRQTVEDISEAFELIDSNELLVAESLIEDISIENEQVQVNTGSIAEKKEPVAVLQEQDINIPTVQNSEEAISVQGPPSLTPEDPEKKKDVNETQQDRKSLHPHGKYEDARYHHAFSTGSKSRAPKNGQNALDNSFSIGENSNRRIGISDGEFVVLDKTSEGMYHGHVREWHQLRDKMQNPLIKARLVTPAGKIIK